MGFEQLSLFGTAITRTVGPDQVKAVQDRMQGCMGCSLCGSRKQVVVGRGKLEKPLLAIVAGAPDNLEDWSGQPIGGAPGALLDKILDWMEGIKREDQFLVHAVACRPDRFREPTATEQDACRPYLHNQLIAVQPQFIVTFGVAAARGVLPLKKKDNKQVESSYGTWQEFEKIPVMPTYALPQMIGTQGKNYLALAYTHLRRVARNIRALNAPQEEETQDVANSEEPVQDQ